MPRVLAVFCSLLLLLLLGRVACKIYQSSPPGEIAVMTYDVTLSAGASACGSLHASGDLTIIDAMLNFDSHFYDFFATPADMALQVQEMDVSGNVLQCFIYGGYDFNAPGCGKTGKWPNSWHTTSDGTYNAAANVTRAHFSGTLWSICIANGWEGGLFDVTYAGTLTFPSLLTTGVPPTHTPSQAPSGAPTLTLAPTRLSEPPSSTPSLRPSSPPQMSLPTTQPSASLPDVMALASSCGETVVLDFDAYLRGADTVCVNFGANSSLLTVNMTMDYGGNDDEVAGDMTLIVYHSTSLFGIQVGGHNYYIPTVKYIGPWPSSWQSSLPGSYSAEVNVSAGHLGGGEGYYYACILNGWYYGELEHYSGKVVLDNLVTQCGGSGAPSLAPSAFSELHSGGGGDSEDEETAIILAAVLVPALLCFTAALGYVLWRRKNEKISRQSLATAELSEISKDVSRSARAMSSQVNQDESDSNSDSEGSGGEGDGADNKSSVDKQRLEAYKKHQKKSTKQGSYEPPGIANPLLQCLEQEGQK